SRSSAPSPSAASATVCFPCSSPCSLARSPEACTGRLTLPRRPPPPSPDPQRMNRLVALVSGVGWHVQDLARAARSLHIGFDPFPCPSVTGSVPSPGSTGRVDAGGINLFAVDAVLVRMMPPGSLEQVVFCMDALHRVEAAGVPVWNPPRAIEAAVDKYLAL